MTREDITSRLLAGLTHDQSNAVKSEKRRILVVAGAGSGKTEVMARRIAWWVGLDRIPKEHIVALTFTEKAADEMKFRVRRWIGEITDNDEEVNLGGMYVGTIHGYCLAKVREYWPDDYHNYDILDEAARTALILRGFYDILGLQALRSALGSNTSQSETVDQFVTAYDQLHEHNRFDVALPSGPPPYRLGDEEQEWCRNARLLTEVGADGPARAFAQSASRYYAYLRCRRFLDFSSSQTEFFRNLQNDARRRQILAENQVHVVVDEVQDLNPIQRDLITSLVGDSGSLTAVGDHRQSIYGFRGAKVEIIGALWKDLMEGTDSEVVDLQHNFRSTPRIIEIANRWAATISPVGGMATPGMLHGKPDRTDVHPSHVAQVRFEDRNGEAAWISRAIRALVPSQAEGAEHDRRDGTVRGIALSDIAVLVRSSTDIRTYMRVFEEAGIPSVVRAGPDLFSQPEVLFFSAALAISAGIEQFHGSPHDPKNLPARIRNVLGCPPQPEPVLRTAGQVLHRSGLPLGSPSQDHVLHAAEALHRRINGNDRVGSNVITSLRSRSLSEFLAGSRPVRRVFPQQIYHWLLAEAEVERWDTCVGRGEAAMFHIGTLSGLIKGIETPGWTSAADYKWQMIGLCQYGTEGGRTPEQPLIVQPDAVTISTIHGAKGLEFAAVFLADVCARRFPSGFARRRVRFPLSGSILQEIDIDSLSDNDNYDGERRLMYVAVTRAERFLVVSHSGSQTSSFVRELRPIVSAAGGTVTANSDELLDAIRHARLEFKRETQLSTSFSDLRYYLACPHDFYLRKVLGFSPTIDQAFGYGRGVHNLMRAVHSHPEIWAELARDHSRLESALRELVDRGLFYLRYTTGDPAENMRTKGVRIVADYIQHYAEELQKLKFEPEKEFETLVEYEDTEGGAMVSGAVDILRLDEPPRVTLIDFKSGDPESDKHQSLDEEEMRLQVGVYAVAAKKELEYEPETGLVRYLDVNRDRGDQAELEIPLDATAVQQARRTVLETARAIRDREFVSNPRKLGRDGQPRCMSCDFLKICGMEAAMDFKRKNPGEL